LIRYEEQKGVTMKRRQGSLILTSLLVLLGCTSGISSDNLVYLTARWDLAQALCGNRKALTRIGGDGAIAGPKTTDGTFTIPAGQSFILTDIHMLMSNGTTGPLEQVMSVYINGPSSGAAGETVMWTGSATAAPQSNASYERALTTGIRVAAPAQICVAVSDQQHTPQIVLSGYLQ
jgi:hypothetical protein